jgi:hypothetical protein
MTQKTKRLSDLGPAPGLMEVHRAADGIQKAAEALDELPYLDPLTRGEVRRLAQKGKDAKKKAADFALRKTG